MSHAVNTITPSHIGSTSLSFHSFIVFIHLSDSAIHEQVSSTISVVEIERTLPIHIYVIERIIYDNPTSIFEVVDDVVFSSLERRETS